MKNKNIQLQNLVVELTKLGKKVPAYKRIALELSKSRRSFTSVNIEKINKFARDGETVVVPGKVLSLGTLEKKITVAAYQFSEAALEKLGSNAITIKELIKKNPKANKVRIMK